MVRGIHTGKVQGRCVLQKAGERLVNPKRRQVFGMGLDDWTVDIDENVSIYGRMSDSPWCSWNWMKNSAKNPADRTIIRVGSDGSVHRNSATLSSRVGWRLCAMTIV